MVINNQFIYIYGLVLQNISLCRSFAKHFNLRSRFIANFDWQRSVNKKNEFLVLIGYLLLDLSDIYVRWSITVDGKNEMEEITSPYNTNNLDFIMALFCIPNNNTLKNRIGFQLKKIILSLVWQASKDDYLEVFSLECRKSLAFPLVLQWEARWLNG